MNAQTGSSTRERSSGQTSAIGQSALLDVDQVAALLRCSTRHIYRLTDRDLMPPPLKLGTLVRWRRGELTEWIDRGCPSVPAVTDTGGRDG